MGRHKKAVILGEARSEAAPTPITIIWGKGVAGTFRGPAGLRAAIDEFLRELHHETGISFTRNEFMLNAFRYYLRYLMRLQSEREIAQALKEPMDSLDEPVVTPQTDEKVESQDAV